MLPSAIERFPALMKTGFRNCEYESARISIDVHSWLQPVVFRRAMGVELWGACDGGWAAGVTGASRKDCAGACGKVRE